MYFILQVMMQTSNMYEQLRLSKIAQVATNVSRQALDLPANYKTVIEIIKFLKIQKLSSIFQSLHQSVLVFLQSEDINLYGQSFRLSPDFSDFFQSERLYPGLASEPLEIVHIKKLLVLIADIESLFLEVENLSIANLDPESKMHRLRMLAVLGRSFRSLKSKSHDLFEKVMDLNNDIHFFVYADNNPISGLLFRILNIFSALHESATAEIPALENMTQILSNETQKIKESFSSLNIAQELGNFLGKGVQMMDYHGEQSPFWEQALAGIPLFLNSITEMIHKFSDKFSGNNTQPSKDMQDLNRRLDKILKDFKGVNKSDVLGSLKLIPILYNLKDIFEIFKLFIKNLGHVKHDLQDLIKEKIRLLKFDILNNAVIFLDELEIQLMLEPGQLTEKFFLNFEPYYANLIEFLSEYLEFNEIGDEDILRLCDVKWDQNRLDASYLRKAKSFFQLKEFSLQERCVQSLLNNDDLPSLKYAFAVLSGYIKKVSPETYNTMLSSLANGHYPKTDQSFIEKINVLVQQYYLSAKFFESRLNRSHLYLEETQTRMGLFLESESIVPEHFKRRLGNSPALVRLNHKFYFYDGFNSKYPLRELSNFPVEIKVMANNTLRYLDSIELNSLLLCVGHTLSRPLALKSFQAATDEQWQYKLEINESAILKLKDVGSKKIANLESMALTDLLKILKVYKSLFFWFEKTEDNINAFFNDIKSLYCCDKKSILDTDRKNYLALSLIKTGAYLDKEPLEKLQKILGNYTRINVHQLQSWAQIYHLQVIENIKLIKTEGQKRFAKLLITYNRKNRLDLAEKFTSFVELPRAEYFLTSTSKSDYFRNLQIKLQNFQPYFVSYLQPLLGEQERGGFEDLLKFKNYLEQPQQLILYKWTYNMVVAIKEFCELLESLKRKDFINGFRELNSKLDIVMAFLNAWKYVYKGARTHYYQNSFHQFGNQLVDFASTNFSQLKEFNLLSDNNDEISSVDQIIHWFLNGNEILEFVASSSSNTEQFKARIQQNSDKTLQSIKKIIAASNSYFKLFLSTGTIYSLLTVCKKQLFLLPKTVYDLNCQNLIVLKQNLFAQMMKAVEKLELDFGIDPNHFSGPINSILDIIFEHYLIALNPDLLVFSKVMLDTSLEENRLRFFQEELASSSMCKTNYEKYGTYFSRFIDLYEQNAKIFRYMDDNHPNIVAFKEQFIVHIAPRLFELKHLQDGQIEPLLRTHDEIFWDERFSRWIAEANIVLDTTEYIKFIKNCNSYFIGMIKTEQIKQQQLTEKFADLSSSKKEKIASVKKKLKQYLENYYDQYTEFYLRDNQPDFIYFKEEHHFITQQFLKLNRGNKLQELSVRFEDEYQKQFNPNISYSISDGVMHQVITNSILHQIQDINHLVLAKFKAFDKILETVSCFEAYINFINEKLLKNQLDNFEDLDSLQLKREKLEQLKNIIQDKTLHIDERYLAVYDFIFSPEFKKTILATKAPCGHWLVQFLNKCYQKLLEILAFFRLLDLPYANAKRIAKEIQQHCNLNTSIPLTKTKQGLFESINLQPEPLLAPSMNI